jgi:hypothetical protein
VWGVYRAGGSSDAVERLTQVPLSGVGQEETRKIAARAGLVWSERSEWSSQSMALIAFMGVSRRPLHLLSVRLVKRM